MIQIAPRQFVQIHFPRERVLALHADHRDLCDFDANSAEFSQIGEFIETALEDARLKIRHGSPECDLLSENYARLTADNIR